MVRILLVIVDVYRFLLFVVNERPVLKADAIKYIMTFRSVLPREMVIGALPQLIRHLTSESAVVHTYAACTIEKILIIRDNLHQPMLVFLFHYFKVKILYYSKQKLCDLFICSYESVCHSMQSH